MFSVNIGPLTVGVITECHDAYVAVVIVTEIAKCNPNNNNCFTKTFAEFEQAKNFIESFFSEVAKETSLLKANGWMQDEKENWICPKTGKVYNNSMNAFDSLTANLLKENGWRKS